jgi:GNAT superfamily N-acetyltransferase
MIRLRPAGPVDADAIADVWWRARIAAIPAIPPPVHDEREVRDWFRDVVLPERDVTLAERDGLIVGLLVLDGASIDQLYVEPGSTSRGVGGALIDVAKAARPTGLDLWTFQSNLGARRFYERHGFVAVATTAGENEEGAPDVRYRWSGSVRDG